MNTAALSMNTEEEPSMQPSQQHARGTPYGLAMAPVIKVASRTALAKRWSDLIDIDAGTIASGDATIEQVGEQIFRMILDVASGRHQTFADHWGLHNEFALFNPSPIT
jgi:galactarate dehydratase